jgi:lipopolysaccharide exporter
MLLWRMVSKALGFVSTLILARLLVPADFGLIAMAMSVIAIIDMVNSFGLDMALIQKENPTRAHYDTVWTMQLLLYMFCGMLIGLVAYPAALFFQEPRLTAVMVILAFSWGLNGLVNVGIVNFRKRMEFRKEFTYLATRRLIGFVATVSLALTFRTYWALVVGVLVTRITGVLLSYVMEPYRPKWHLGSWREFFAFSQWMAVNNIVLIGVVRFPHFVIGRVLGAGSLGLFTVGTELGSLAVTELAAPVNRAVFPAYARLAGEREALKNAFLQVGAAVLLFALPASVGLALVAKPAVLLLLGQKWSEAVPVVQISALAAACIAAATNNGVAYIALGIPKATAMMSMVRLMVLVLLSVYAVREYGLVGVAVADLVASAACLVVSFPLVFRRLGVTIGDYARGAWRSVISTLIMAWFVSGVSDALDRTDSGLDGILVLIAVIVSGAFVYSLSLLTLWFIAGKPTGAEDYLIKRFPIFRKFARL